MSAEPAPLDAAIAPPIDRYCDLVLTGGVTDGVIYPWAVLELAREYRFKNVGGTSVGAMAAALTAAAEYGRRYGSLAGFNEVLLKLPRKLGEDVNGTTRLYSLFQPAKSTRRLFDLFVSFFASEGFLFGAGSASYSAAFRDAEKSDSPAPRKFEKARKFLELAFTVVRLYRLPALFAALLALLGLALAVWPGLEALLTLPAWRLVAMLFFAVIFLTLPAMLLFGLVFIGYALYCDLVHGLVPNGFGLCSGGRVEGTPDGQPPLIEWLHEGIQAAAGKPLDRPLTFKDLWDAPGGPAGQPVPPARGNRKPRSIDLRMVTTNLTHGRPYGLPLNDKTTSRLFFKIRELERFFPPQVIDHLKKCSKPYTKTGNGDPDETPKTRQFLELPKGELPVVVAARLSLNFPVLFSAVPLWAIDYEAKPGSRRLRRCRFSDGGICSNFPIHLFDAAIPSWPTFGINLAPKDIWNDVHVWLPKLHDEGGRDSWFRFDDTRSLKTGKAIPPLDRLVGFAASIVFTAKDWNDKTAMRMPGVRDRTVHTYLRTGEGGLNLKMRPEQIMDLATAYGQPAGKELVWKFLHFAEPKRASFWDEHRWVRFNTHLVGLRERLEALTAAAEFAGHCKPISRQLREARRIAPLRDEIFEQWLSELQASELELLLAALKDLESGFGQAEAPQPYGPVPVPSLRIRPPL